MTMGELVEILIYMRNKHDFSKSEDDAICNACNILDQFPRMLNTAETLSELKGLKH